MPPTPSGDKPRVSPPRAAVLLIGNELLSGKIRDENGWFLAKVCRRRGIELCEVRTVGDGIDDIGRGLTEVLARAPLVFTSGGVGPTHDDRTLEAIAKATGLPLERNPAVEVELRKHYGERLTDEALTMADLPRGTLLRAGPRWPILRLDVTQPRPGRIYILPGVPPLLRAKVERLETLPDELPQGEGWHLVMVHSTVDESQIAATLDAILEGFPEVEIGSYPRWSRDTEGRVSYHVRLTLEGPTTATDRINAARDALLAALPPDSIIPPPEGI